MRRGWQAKRLGDVATLQRGFDLPTQNRVAGEFPLVSSSGISDTHHKCAVCGPGVVTGRSGSIGNVFFIEEDFWPLNTALYVKDFHGNDPRFVFHLLKKFDLQRFASGAGVPTLNRNFVHDELVSVPPVPEQRRIVAILDEAFEAIAPVVANAEKNLSNAGELFEIYLNSVFSEKGEGWVEKPTAQIATKIGSGATPRGGQESYKSEGIPLIRSLNVHDRKFKYDDLAFLHDGQAEKLDNVIVQKGDVLLNITGASVARCCQVPDDVLPARVNQHVSIIRPIQSIVSPRFLEYALTAGPNKDRLLGVGEKGGSTRQAITKAEIQEFRLAYPPIDAQAVTTSRLDELSIETSRLENVYQQKLDSLAELKQAILQKAFAGELTAQPEQFLREAVA